MAFRARKVFGSFEKRTPGGEKKKRGKCCSCDIVNIDGQLPVVR